MTNAKAPWINIRMYPKTNYVPGHPVSVSLTSDTTLRLANTFYRFGIGAVPVGESDRKVCEGPLVDGPWAYAFGLCTVIDNYPERRKAEYDADVIVDEGDVLQIDARYYRVHIVRREFIELVECDQPYVAPTEGFRELNPDMAAETRHVYEVTSTRDCFGNRPMDDDARLVDVLHVKVHANSRTQATSIVKKYGLVANDVNMIG